MALFMGLQGSDQLSKSRRSSKSDQWFKSYGQFTEGVDFASWWSFSGGGSAINGATPSNFERQQHNCCSFLLSTHQTFPQIQSVFIRKTVLYSGSQTPFAVHCIGKCFVQVTAHFQRDHRPQYHIDCRMLILRD